jgi:dCTP diphosphatase
MKKLTKEIISFRDKRDWKKFHTPANLAKSLVIEAGELLEHFQWLEADYDKKEVANELADVLIYSLLLADTLNFDISKIVLSKLALNAKKYPIKLARGSAKKYSKLKQK